MLIHCLNPYGMAWLRRGNEKNVDLNRNFLFNGQVFGKVSDTYRHLNGLLNPQQESRLVDWFYVHALWHVLCHGSRGPKQAVASTE